MESFIPSLNPPIYKESKNMFTEEIQEMVEKAFSDATMCPVGSIKISVNKVDEKETMSLAGTSTQTNGESTTTSLMIEDLGRSNYRFIGKVESPTRNLSFNKGVVCSSPNTLPQMVKSVLAMSRVLKKKDPNLIGKIGNKIGSIYHV